MTLVLLVLVLFALCAVGPHLTGLAIDRGPHVYRAVRDRIQGQR